MVYWLTADMGGEIPRRDPKLLPDNNATECWNADLSSGALTGLPTPQFLEDLTSQPGQAAYIALFGGAPAKKAFRWPDPAGVGGDIWLPLPSPYSSPVLSPLTDDTSHRIYWTNPPGSPMPGPWFTTRDNLINGVAPFNLGFTAPAPGSAPTIGLDISGSARVIAQNNLTSAQANLAATQVNYQTALNAYNAANSTLSNDNQIVANLAAIMNSAQSILQAQAANLNQANASGNATWISQATTLYNQDLANFNTAQTNYNNAVTQQQADLATQQGAEGFYVTLQADLQAAQNAVAAAQAALAVAPVDVSRSYVYTFVDEFGLESSPSSPSAVASGPPDAIWQIGSLPLAAPAPPAGKNYPAVIGMRLYRTVTGTTTGAAFYLVTDLLFSSGIPNPYIDATADQYVVLNNTLVTGSYTPPPDNLDGLVSFPGGMLIGFVGNSIYFCEPFLPHAWPAEYIEGVLYPVLTLAVWQQTLMVLTQGFPFTGNGVNPANFTFAQVQVAEPCIARGSVITDLLGVYYASQNGLVMLSYYGMVNQTLQTMTKNIWLDQFKAQDIIACRHRAQYLAMKNDGSGTGFIVDYTDPRQAIDEISVFADSDCIWNDPYTGDAYICSGNKVYLWDSPDPTVAPLNYRWRSKQFYLSAPGSLGACQMTLSPDVLLDKPAPTVPTSNGDASLDLPPGVNCVFRLYAGAGQLVYEKNIMEERPVFRLPSGFLAFDWQFEVVSNTPIFRVELASTMEELKRV